MNNVDEIHQLLDGELADEHVAELLHRLSVDPEKRLLFRQQILLQNALHHNESFDGLSVVDDWAVLEGIASEVGLDTPTPARRGISTLAMLGLLLVGLVVGGGAGYISGRATAAELAAARPADTVTIVETLALPITRPQLALDELAVALGIEGHAALAPKPETAATPKSPSRTRRSGRYSGMGTDVTGSIEARKLREQQNGGE